MGSELLRVGIIAPPWLPIPPPAYGGTELVVDGLCQGLERAGHVVVLFTTGDSECPVERRWLYERSDPARMGNVVIAVRHALAAYDALDDVDIIHDHTVVGPLLSERFADRPVVTTIHGAFDEDLSDLYGRIDHRVPIVAISHNQAGTAPASLRIAGVIPHGIDLQRYPVGDGTDHLLFLGRMSQDKGIEDAIEAARAAGMPLRIAAKMREQSEIDYFESRIQPLLGCEVEYVGEIGFEEKVALLSEARALINPIHWPEPFGLVMIEAMACGTPVLAYDAGDASEIIDDGVTGFLASDLDGLVQGLLSLDRIDRGRCRAVVEQRFSADRMVQDYTELYRSCLADPTLINGAAPQSR